MRGATIANGYASLSRKLFQSTLPVRGATFARKCFIALSRDFNPRSPCGERHLGEFIDHIEKNFNPRSPCGERLKNVIPKLAPLRFQSTLPVRGATGSTKRRSREYESFQSTLPVRGATYDWRSCARVGFYFNPRSPCGERHALISLL